MDESSSTKTGDKQPIASLKKKAMSPAKSAVKDSGSKGKKPTRANLRNSLDMRSRSKQKRDVIAVETDEEEGSSSDLDSDSSE